MQDLTIQTTLEVGGVVLFLFIAVVAVVLYFRRKPKDQTVESLSDLGNLRNKYLLSPEELKKVRESMARTYLEHEKEVKTKQQKKGMSPLQLLELEAQRVAIQKPEAAPQEVPKERSAKSLLPAAPPPPPSSPKPEESVPQIPARLKPFLATSEVEWDALVQSGFLSEEDFELLKSHRRNSG